jgi:hypothetical protein
VLGSSRTALIKVAPGVGTSFVETLSPNSPPEIPEISPWTIVPEVKQLLPLKVTVPVTGKKP